MSLGAAGKEDDLKKKKKHKHMYLAATIAEDVYTQVTDHSNALKEVKVTLRRAVAPRAPKTSRSCSKYST